jgi:hypothetical protein
MLRNHTPDALPLIPAPPPPPPHGATGHGGPGPPQYLASRSHTDTPHSVGLLWTGDQPDTETST